MSPVITPFENNLYIAARILLWICLTLAIIFPFLYHYTSKGTWSFTPIGRHVMQFRTVFALLLLFTALSVFVPFIVTVGAALVLYSVTLLILAQQIRFLIKPKVMDPQDLLDADPDVAPQESRLLIRQENPPVKSRPVVIMMSILAALQMLFGGLAALNLPDGSYSATVLTVGAFGTLAVAAAQFGLQFYVQNLVTPHVDVAAYKNDSGNIVAGPAAPPEGQPVDVVDEDTHRLH